MKELKSEAVKGKGILSCSKNSQMWRELMRPSFIYSQFTSKALFPQIRIPGTQNYFQFPKLLWVGLIISFFRCPSPAWHILPTPGSLASNSSSLWWSLNVLPLKSFHQTPKSEFASLPKLSLCILTKSYYIILSPWFIPH